MVNNHYFATLDIETSTIYEDENCEIPKFVWLSFGYCNLYNVKGERVEKHFFRTWEQLDDILSVLTMWYSKSKLLCYVHNLAYEFDFLIKNISRPTKILSNTTHHVIMAQLAKYNNIEFRCSYLLTGYPLRKLGEIVKLPKLEADYNIIYPNEKVPEEYKTYCIRDNDIIAKYIVEVMLKEYKMLSNIPYTKTGRVRKKLKEYYKEETDTEWDKMPSKECLHAMEQTFAGGLCIVNPLFAKLKLKNVRSFDETSAYPFAMLAEKFPYDIKKYDGEMSKSLIKNDFWIAKIAFKNITAKYNWGWLSISKMEHRIKSDEVYFNGKLLESKYIERHITNIDFECIKETYNFDDFEIMEFYKMDKYDKLPYCYIKTIEEFAVKKGTLKEMLAKDEENTDLKRDYMLAKNDFNSIYGMTVQKIVQHEFLIDENFEWKVKENDYVEDPEKHLKRNFLFGIYVTAYARRNLLKGIITNCPYTFVYADTDSIKFIGNIEFVDTNKRLIDYAENKYIKNLGKFDDEGIYKSFKTLGAKKYAFEENSKIKMVVAGLPKTVAPIDTLDEFKEGKEFKNCKLGTKYIYMDNEYTYNDDLEKEELGTNNEILEFNKKHGIKSNGGVMLFATSYVLDITYNDKNIIDDFHSAIDIYRELIYIKTGINIYDFMEESYVTKK